MSQYVPVAHEEHGTRRQTRAPPVRRECPLRVRAEGPLRVRKEGLSAHGSERGSAHGSEEGPLTVRKEGPVVRKEGPRSEGSERRSVQSVRKDGPRRGFGKKVPAEGSERRSAQGSERRSAQRVRKEAPRRVRKEGPLRHPCGLSCGGKLEWVLVADVKESPENELQKTHIERLNANEVLLTKQRDNLCTPVLRWFSNIGRKRP